MALGASNCAGYLGDGEALAAQIGDKLAVGLALAAALEERDFDAFSAEVTAEIARRVDADRGRNRMVLRHLEGDVKPRSRKHPAERDRGIGADHLGELAERHAAVVACIAHSARGDRGEIEEFSLVFHARL